MRRIKQVILKDDYCLRIILDNGNSVFLDLKNKLHTIRFGLLMDKEFFHKATTDGNFILWEDKVQISINEALQLELKE